MVEEMIDVLNDTPSNPTAPPPPPSSPALDGGEIAGIAIGSVFAVVLIGLVVYWFCFRKKNPTVTMEGTASYGAQAGKEEGRNMPMVALRVSGHDEDL